MSYKRGDVVWVQFPFTDLTKTKVRPALIVSNNDVNSTGDYILVQITSRVKNDEFSIPLEHTDYLEAPLNIKSYVRVHKIFTLNDNLIAGKGTAVNNNLMQYVVSKLNTLISNNTGDVDLSDK